MDHFKAIPPFKARTFVFCFTTRCRCFARWTNLNERKRCHWTKRSSFIDLFIHYYHFSCWCWSREQLPRGEGGVSPGRVASLLQSHRERQTAWSWKMRNSENWESIQTPHGKTPGLGLEPTTFLLWGNSTNHLSRIKQEWNGLVQRDQVIFWRSNFGWLLVSMCWTCDKLSSKT